MESKKIFIPKDVGDVLNDLSLAYGVPTDYLIKEILYQWVFQEMHHRMCNKCDGIFEDVFSKLFFPKTSLSKYINNDTSWDDEDEIFDKLDEFDPKTMSFSGTRCKIHKMSKNTA